MIIIYEKYKRLITPTIMVSRLVTVFTNDSCFLDKWVIDPDRVYPVNKLTLPRRSQ